MEPLLLHADMAQRQRLRSIEAFAKVPNSTLIATDVAARGLDIKGVDHVIHYNVPVKAEVGFEEKDKKIFAFIQKKITSRKLCSKNV